MYKLIYGELEVTYEIEGDVDGNHAFVRSITNNGKNVPVDKGTMEDIEFHCRSEFDDLQTKHYLRTGETL